MSQPTPLYQLVESKIPGTLSDYVASRRATTSWRAMAVDLTELTGVTVTYATLHGWFAGRIETTVTVTEAGAA